MKRLTWVLALVLIPMPAVAQQDEEDTLFQLRIGAVFAEGNLALQHLQAENHPVQQMKRFLRDARLPLSSSQERELYAIVDAQITAVQASPQNQEDLHRVNQEYTTKFYNVLTPDQRTSIRRYRTDQIMMYGGFPALKVILENAQIPLTTDQEQQVRALYDEFFQQYREMPRNAKGAPERTVLDKVENTALARVVRLLTPAQRKALAASRQSLNQRRE
jgi:Spy/CpxP family protein refolding chaperone